MCWDLRKPGTILYHMNRTVTTNQRVYFDLDRFVISLMLVWIVISTSIVKHNINHCILSLLHWLIVKMIWLCDEGITDLLFTSWPSLIQCKIETYVQRLWLCYFLIYYKLFMWLFELFSTEFMCITCFLLLYVYKCLQLQYMYTNIHTCNNWLQ